MEEATIDSLDEASRAPFLDVADEIGVAAHVAKVVEKVTDAADGKAAVDGAVAAVGAAADLVDVAREGEAPREALAARDGAVCPGPSGDDVQIRVDATGLEP